ncbi:hypothetical protein [Dendrosporobacter sp. 1207_IL3150]|uniref:hypothetical protein n=1 Tax=Dendrosporobacter sp. 1207_IL3150 TaxID=3084054 RepID=UPI002FDAC67B
MRYIVMDTDETVLVKDLISGKSFEFDYFDDASEFAQALNQQYLSNKQDNHTRNTH